MSCYLNLEGVEQSARRNDMKKLLIAHVLMNEMYSVGQAQFLDNVIITSIWWSKLLWKKLLANKPVIEIRLGFRPTGRRLSKIIAWSLFCFVLIWFGVFTMFYLESPHHLQWNLFIDNQGSLIACFSLKTRDQRRILVLTSTTKQANSRAELLAIETSETRQV